jgi:hypothetical protein
MAGADLPEGSEALVEGRSRIVEAALFTPKIAAAQRGSASRANRNRGRFQAVHTDLARSFSDRRSPWLPSDLATGVRVVASSELPQPAEVSWTTVPLR